MAWITCHCHDITSIESLCDLPLASLCGGKELLPKVVEFYFSITLLRGFDRGEPLSPSIFHHQTRAATSFLSGLVHA